MGITMKFACKFNPTIQVLKTKLHSWEKGFLHILSLTDYSKYHDFVASRDTEFGTRTNAEFHWARNLHGPSIIRWSSTCPLTKKNGVTEDWIIKALNE